MKFLFLSDTHFAVKLPHARIDGDATNSDRLRDCSRAFWNVIRHCDNEKIEAVFILGDLFDVASPDMPTLKVVGGLLKELARHTSVCLLPGNHDAHDRKGGAYSLDLFDVLKIPNVFVLGQGWTRFTINGSPISFLSIPWVPDADVAQIVESFNDDREEPKLALLHQTIDGCLEGKHRLSSPLKAETFDSFDLALCGHIHRPQVIGNVQYLGSPIPLRFNDADGEPRGYWSLDGESLELTLHPIEETPTWLSFRINADTEDFDFASKPVGITNPLFDDDTTMVDALNTALDADHVYIDFKIRGERENVERICEGLDELEEWARELHGPAKTHGDVRLWRRAKIITDDGASDRIRTAISSGGVASPEELVEAFVVVACASSELFPGIDEKALIEFGKAALSGVTS